MTKSELIATVNKLYRVLDYLNNRPQGEASLREDSQIYAHSVRFVRGAIATLKNERITGEDKMSGPMTTKDGFYYGVERRKLDHVPMVERRSEPQPSPQPEKASESLVKACELAAKEIYDLAGLSRRLAGLSRSSISAIIYKHMREQREL